MSACAWTTWQCKLTALQAVVDDEQDQQGFAFLAPQEAPKREDSKPTSGESVESAPIIHSPGVTYSIGVTHVSGIDQSSRDARSWWSLGSGLDTFRHQFDQLFLRGKTSTGRGSRGIVEDGSSSRSGYTR